MRRFILALAVLILPVHFVTDGFVTLVDNAHVGSQVAEMDTRCAQVAATGAACMADDPLEVSTTADAADALARDTSPLGFTILAAMAMLHSVSFPASVYPQIASPPPRA